MYNKERIKIIVIICTVFLLIATIFINAYISKTFPAKAIVNNINVSEYDAKKAETKINNYVKRKGIKIKIGQKRKAVKFKIPCVSEKDLKKVILKSRLNIFTYFNLKKNYKLTTNLPDNKKLKEKIKRKIRKAFPFGVYPEYLKNKKGVITKNAHINAATMTIIPEKYGNNLDYKKLTKKVIENIECGEWDMKLKAEKFFKKPKIKKDNKYLKKELDFYKDFSAKTFKIKMPSDKKYKLDNSDIMNIVKYDGKSDKTAYSKKGSIKVVKKAINKVTAKNNIIEIETKTGKKYLNDFDNVLKFNIKKTAEILIENIKNDGPITEIEYVNAEKILKTRVEVNRKDQKVYLFVNGKQKLTTDCVTGTTGHETPTGIYNIDWKTTNTVLRGFNDDGSKYESPVTYWMPFNGGIGLHDATWRGEFGGDIHINNGSHGCVNMPLQAAKKIYGKVQNGTPVIVYD